MKRKTFFTALAFVLIFTGFIYLKPSSDALENSTQLTPPAPQSNSFLFGSMDSWQDEQDNYEDYDQLGLNFWHAYPRDDYSQIPGRNTPKSPLAVNDRLFDSVSSYAVEVKGKLNELYTQHNSRSFLTRPKLEWLSYGQSSKYQCEGVSHVPASEWFYTFNSNNSNRTYYPNSDYNDNSSFGGNIWVKRCLAGAQSECWVVDRLKANTEQCNSGGHWTQDTKCDWYVKPRVRIPASFVVPANYETPICKITIIEQNGSTVKKEIIIKAKYFLDDLGQYDGSYIEKFNFFNEGDQIFHGDLGDKASWSARGHLYSAGEEDSSWIKNRADIQVWWYGYCDMYIDYVKVENDVADELFRGNRDKWIQDEVELIGNQIDPAVFSYYVELFEYNNVPCMAYVNQKIKDYSGNKLSLVADFNPVVGMHIRWWQQRSFFEPANIVTNVMEKVGFKYFFSECYPMTGRYSDPPDMNPDSTFSRIPNTLPNHTPGNNHVLALPVSPLVYDEWLQNNLDKYPFYMEDGAYPEYTNLNNSRKSAAGCTTSVRIDQEKGYFQWIMKISDYMSKHGYPFLHMPQAHQWYWPLEVRREPTNEELDMLANIPITYGAKGLMYFYYPYDNFEQTPCIKYGIGMENNDNSHTLRTNNVYNESKYKWHQFRDIGLRMKKWEPYIMNFDDASRKSYTYRIEAERYAMYQNTYFSDVFTYKYGSGPYPCSEDFPEGDVPPNNTIGECKDERYLQVATFEKTNELNTNYFMMVNRRCSPHYEPGEDPRFPNGEYSGYRRIKININPNSPEVRNFNNWNIIDTENPLSAAIPYRRGEPYVDLGWFEPGQGKLYIMIPTVKAGGILTEDEIITGESFTCEAPVYNNGHNITIGANTTIHFNDSSRFVMDGGVFTVGDQNTSAPQNITSDAVPGGSWKGHSFTNCEVKIYGAAFTGLANDTTYAVNIIDCPVVDIRNCTFNTNSSLKGGVNAICFSNPFLAINNIYIGSNTFNSSGSTIPTVNVSSYAGVTTPLIIENNTFTEGNTAIFLSGVIGGAIKGNTITDNYIGINALTSSIDVVQNNISSTVNGSMGIFAAGGSELKLNSSGAFTLGGLNNISNEGTGTNNINVDGSYFLLDDGENIFNISSDQSSYHLYGYFLMFTAVTTEETNNCFKVNSSPVDPPVNMVTSGYQGSQITFNFIPYLSGCEIPDGGDGLAINLGDGIYDTIYTGGSGSGGSMKEALPLNKGEYPQGEGVLYTTPTPKEKYDSVCVLMRYRNYSQAKTKCLDLINTYPDSIQSLNAVLKLFLSTVASDTSYNAANYLKIFYENLILNNQSNISLVKRANYYILKCKVRMREYSQALAGFQQIINQNPYSYEGLIARWDYMATSLLIQGQGGGERGISDLGLENADLESEDLYDNPQSENRNPNSTGDKNPFTKEQRQDIRKSINTAIDVSKNNDETKMKTLEEKSELGDVNATKELTQMKSLKQVVKTEKPKSITQHIKIVSEDIRKVFGTNTSGKGNQPKNLPTVFRISQNYPNPFNPVTKINYDLPKDSKVKIIIYDILGREVKRLVNNELKTAGSYIVDFNAMNYASGVYFYRIEAEEPNGNKFVDSKKMVLIK